MGSSASKEEAPPEAAAGGFSVRMTPELLQRASESSANTEAPVTTTRGESDETRHAHDCRLAVRLVILRAACTRQARLRSSFSWPSSRARSTLWV